MDLKENYKPKQVLKNFLLTCEHGCDWKTTVLPDEVMAWHNKPCPRCGKGIIVNDYDLAEFKRLTGVK